MYHIYKSNLITAHSSDEMEVLPDSYIIEKDGYIEYVGKEIPEEYKGYEVTDYNDKLLIPGFSDIHVHAPQYAQRGIGMDVLLFDWLNNYTFPEESKYQDISYAAKIYPQLIRDLLRHGTLHVTPFSSIHYDASSLLYRMLGESGMYAYAGKINMDMNSQDYYVEETQKSIEDTERFILEHTDLYGDRVRPIIMPRFAPTCSDELLKGLGKLAEKYDLGLHTHLVESKAEAAWSKELFPQYLSDGDIYEQTGLLKGKGPKIFAHVIFPTEVEEKILKEYDCVSVHCPDSTGNITAGIMPLKEMQEKGLRIAYGSDVGGGQWFGIYRQMARSIQQSKIKEFYEERPFRLELRNAFYHATAQGGSIFGKIGKLEKGYRFNVLVIDKMEDEGTKLSIEEALERFCYAGDDRNIKARYIDGKLVDPDEVYERLIEMGKHYEQVD